MSSYQFVNTLAQCYSDQQQQQQQQQSTAAAAAAAAAAANAAQTSQQQQDYYNMNYPNCYSPNLAAHAQYGQYSLMMGQQENGWRSSRPL